MSAKRKIIHISTHYHPANGGQQIYIKNLINAFPEFEHHVMQLASSSEEYPENVIAITPPKWFSYKAIKFYAFNNCVKRKLNFFVLMGVFDPDYDIVLCHYAFHLSAVRAFKYVIVLSHGVEWDGPGSLLRKLYHYHRYLINKFAISMSKASFVANDVNYFNKLGYQVSSAEYFKAIANDRWLIPNCIDVYRFFSSNSGVSLLPEKSIIVPRNIVPQRGMEVVITAFSKLLEIKEFEQHKLVIVGAIYDVDYFKFLKSLIAGLKIDRSVIFYGSARSDEMPDIFNSAEMTVIFSLFREGTSLAALESMSCGTPVVTSDVGGLREIPSIKSDAESLHTTMAKILRDRTAVGNHQMELVRKTYNHANWRNSWSNVFSRFLK